MRTYAASALALLLPSFGAGAQTYRASDSELHCLSTESCSRLIGRKVWGTINTSEICSEVNPAKGCRKLSIGTVMTIDGVTGAGSLDTFFLMRLADGRTGFVRTANAHLLTLTDPRPAQEAEKKRQQAADVKSAQQAAADAAVIAATPKADLEKGCILAAAERLPRIPGIQITSSKALDLPPAHKPPAGAFMGLVEIGAKAAGQDVTYSFICARGARTPFLITPFSQQ